MSVNLVDLVMKQLGGNLPGIIGSLLGESADRTQGALAGAVPAILGGLMGAASKGGQAADDLASAIGQQDDSMLDDLAGMLGGGNHQAMADKGSSMLGSLLGDGVIGSLVGAIGKFSGLGGGSSKSLLGLLVPIVMSVLGREQKKQGLDGGGLLNMLMGQKEHVQQAMPSGMMNALGGGDLLDGIMGTAKSATDSIGEAVDTAAGTAGRAAGRAASAVGEAVEGAGDAAGRAAGNVARGASNVASQAGSAAAGAAETGGSWLRWALPLLILLALIWLAFKFLGGSDVDEAVSDASDAAGAAVEATTEAASDAADAAGDAASAAVEATTEAASDAADATTEAAGDAADATSDAASSAGEMVTAMVGDIDVGKELTSAFDGLTETLGGITDVASAEAALPALEELSTGLDSLTGLAEQLPAEALGGVNEMVGSGLSGLEGLMETLKAIPGVGELIEPIIATIQEKLAAFAPA